MNIDLKTNKKIRYTFNVVGLLCCLGMFTYIYITFIETPESIADDKQTVSTNAQAKKEVKGSVKNSQVVLNENPSKNPFVDITEIRSGKTTTAGANTLPTIPPGNTGNNGLPQIPANYPMPNLPNIPNMGGVPVPLPTIPPNQMNSIQKGTPPTSSTANPSVKGVFTGNDGNNMAIMSDGKIVSTGDSYQDGRIAYIGGDGIQFDDGHTIPYK